MHWMERLLNAFFSFRYARNWRCRFPEHYGAHYQDEVAADGATAEWRLHGHVVARLSKLDGGRLLLELSDAGYPTITTLSRLNAILWKLRVLYPGSPRMMFKLKHTSFLGPPDHTVFLVDGRAYNLRLLPEKTVRILIDGGAVPLLPTGAEYLYFMMHPELEGLRRLHRAVKELLLESRERLSEVERFLSRASNLGEVRERWLALRGRWEAAGRALRELEARYRLSALGVAAGADLVALRGELRGLRAELREVDGAAAELQAVARLLS
jgi:hypothetical protein